MATVWRVVEGTERATRWHRVQGERETAAEATAAEVARRSAVGEEEFLEGVVARLPPSPPLRWVPPLPPP